METGLELRMTKLPVFLLALFVVAAPPLRAQTKEKKAPAPFQWSNPVSQKQLDSKGAPKSLRHGTFTSPSMGVDVGYFIYLPPGYDVAKDERYPVVYHLHGGRPGSEAKSFSLSKFVDGAIQKGEIEPTIYVYPNGGPVSWYDMPDRERAMGETVFVDELIPHIDETFRTISERGSRGIEGFSQGGRGTTRILFKHPQYFGSAAPGGSGYEPEQRIQQNDGYENESLRFLPIGYNTWDLAMRYVDSKPSEPLPILLWVGTKGFNFEFNKLYSAYLTELEIPHEMLIAEGIAHSASGVYEKRGTELMQFHQRNFGRLK